MVKIILILALLQYISNFLFGYKSNILGCGIFGQATNTPENLDVNGVHILGIYNIERGKMSCGLSWDGDVQYGIGFDKLYTDFIVDREIKPISTPIMIGHTRQPSFGMSINKDNAHPFGFGVSKDGKSYSMIFCHNGTLKNHHNLARKYDIETTVKKTEYYPSGNSYESTRTKIDSEILGEVLYKTKNFKVLSEYIGAAACVWTWLDEPNKIYLWSGASKHTQNSAINIETEERPMNVYCKNENSMFFSSLKNSLTVLGASSKDKLQIDYNTVYIITDGDFANAEKHKVSRRKAGQNEEIVNYQSNQRSHQTYYPHLFDGEFLNETPKQSAGSLITNLHNDKPVQELSVYKDKVYSKSLRYWSKGVLISGVYYYIEDYGFKYASISPEGAKNTFLANRDLSFNYFTGYFNYDKRIENDKIIFSKDLQEIPFYYFVDGVMLKNASDYNVAIKLKQSLKYNQKYVDFMQLSFMSKHPIINMSVENTPTIAMIDGKRYTGSFTELGFEKVYTFNNGILSKWTQRQDVTLFKKEVAPVIVLPVVKLNLNSGYNPGLFANSIKAIEQIEKEIIECEILDEQIEKEVDLSNNPEYLKELIMESFEKHSEDINETLLEFSDYYKTEDVENAIHTLNLINHTLVDFIEKPVKK